MEDDEDIETICDSCGTALPLSESESCGRCGQTLCAGCVGEFDHECIEDDDGADE